MNEFFEAIGTWFYDFFVRGFTKTFIDESRYKMYLEGIGNTLLITLFATIIGIIIGSLVAIVKVAYKNDRKHNVILKILNTICEIYTTVIRGTPVVVQLLIMYNIIFRSSTQAVVIGFVSFGINSGAYVSEIIRAGINAVDIGQTEAGRSLGLSSSVTMAKIVLPQAIKNVLPAIGNEFISLLKETSIIGYLGVIDLTRAADRTISRTMDVYFPYISIALVYLALVGIFSFFVKKLERRLGKSDRH